MRKGEIDKEKFLKWIKKIKKKKGKNIIRMKGIIELKEDKERYVVKGVKMIIEGDKKREWKKEEKNERRIVLIGREIDKEELKEGFEK